MADKIGSPRERLNAFKRLAIKAIAKISGGKPGFGTLLDDVYGREAMFDAAKLGLWIGRPLEKPGSRPLRFEFTQDVGARLAEWPITHTIKCLSFYRPDDPQELKAEQAQKLRTLYEAARKVGRELLIEIIAGKHGTLDDDTIAQALEEHYALGIKPDWWKLEPQTTSKAWGNIASVIARNDPWCRGIVLLGLEAPETELAKGFEMTADHPLIKGFAVGRTIFNHPAQAWLAGKLSDTAATDEMAERFGSLVNVWDKTHRL
jgi:5-dehydro-2-deoxygluconokinase